MDEKLRCARCGDVIGAYEPLVIETEGTARLTSCAAEPELLAGPPGDCFHRECHPSTGEEQ